jgi:hypothetical protein
VLDTAGITAETKRSRKMTMAVEFCNASRWCFIHPGLSLKHCSVGTPSIVELIAAAIAEKNASGSFCTAQQLREDKAFSTVAMALATA